MLSELRKQVFVCSEWEFLNLESVIKQTHNYKILHLFILPNGEIGILRPPQTHQSVVDRVFKSFGIDGLDSERLFQKDLGRLQVESNMGLDAISTLRKGMSSAVDIFVQSQGVAKVINYQGFSAIMIPNGNYFGKELTEEQSRVLFALVKYEILSDSTAFENAKRDNKKISLAFERLLGQKHEKDAPSL